MEKISKEHLSLAGEYAVASELCRRGIYAQLTLGTRKKTDILTDTETAKLRIQVKAKQGNRWPCKGVFGENIVLVFVDYENKGINERPDFYILTSSDWENFIKSWESDAISAGKCYLDEENCPVWPSKMSEKKPYEGENVPAGAIAQHKECWDKMETPA